MRSIVWTLNPPGLLGGMAEKVSGTECNVLAGSGTTNVTITPNLTFSSGHAPVFHKNIPRQVIVTPLPVTSVQPASVIKKVLLKAVSKGIKKEPKTFTLRNIDTTSVSTCSALVTLIRAQLHEDITEEGFEIGYLKSNTVVTLRSKEDLCEVWESIKSGNSVMLWCDGMKTPKTTTASGSSKKRPLDIDSDDDNENKKSKRKKKHEGKEEKVESILTDLKSKHGTTFTPMQYRIWAEMVAGGVHCSCDDHPNTSMFLRAGGVGTKKKGHTTTTVISDAITQLTTALSPKPVPTSSGRSPAKLIENRSKCYKQLTELKNLVQIGVLSEEECDAERNAIIDILKTCR